MMIVEKGDLVKMRDGRKVRVTDAADQGVDGLVPVGFNSEAFMPAETIFVGYNIDTKASVVSDMSEVVAIYSS